MSNRYSHGTFSHFDPSSSHYNQVTGDVISFIVQASGAALKAQGGEGKISPDVGTNIVVDGLVFQVIIFGVFMVAAAVFNKRFRGFCSAGNAPGVPWRAALKMLYATSALIMARNVFRVVEYAMGNDGYLLSVEWPVYVFDAGLMSLTMVCFLWWYPSQLMPALGGLAVRSEEVTMSSSGEMEVQRK
ncbi:hypothetical protein ACJ41O_000121 [Fusarium nematophilum]